MSEAKAMKKEKPKRKKSPKKKNVQKKKKESIKFVLKEKKSESFISSFSVQKKKEPDNSVVILYQKNAEKQTLKKQIKSTYLEPKIKPPIPVPEKPKTIKVVGAKK